MGGFDGSADSSVESIEVGRGMAMSLEDDFTDTLGDTYGTQEVTQDTETLEALIESGPSTGETIGLDMHFLEGPVDRLTDVPAMEATEIRFIREHLRRDAQLAMDVMAAHSKKLQYDAKHRQIEFQVGDKVWYE